MFDARILPTFIRYAGGRRNGEAIAHGDEHTSKVVGRSIGELKLPPGATIGAVVRGDEVLIAPRHHSDPAR